MKGGKVIRVTKKGQIVIPKDMRDVLYVREGTSLHISQKGQGLYIQPTEEIRHYEEQADSYLSLLEKTQGTWKDDDWDKATKQRKKIELEASKRRKAW